MIKKLKFFIYLKNISVIITTVFFNTITLAGNARTDFAQSYFGVGVQDLSSLESSNVDLNFSNRQITRISWGGLHFWRHVDFEITFPLSGSTQTSGHQTSYFEAGSTYGFSTLIYPWSLEKHALRPFFGVGFLSGLYFKGGLDVDKAPLVSLPFHPVKIGASYMFENLLLELGIQKIPIENFDYYTDRTSKSRVSLDQNQFYLSTKYVYESTSGAKEDASLSDGAFSFAIGPSSSYALSQLSYNQVNRPWISDRPFQTDLMLEYGVGYFLFSSEVQFNIASKSSEAQNNGYDLNQTFLRDSTTIEIYKYLFDYNGFTPFLGPNYNFDSYTFTEKDGSTTTIHDRENLSAFGLTLGWDIKPVKRMNLFLRTNLRWTFPDRTLFAGKTYEMNIKHFEFNYIQLVIMI